MGADGHSQTTRETKKLKAEHTLSVVFTKPLVDPADYSAVIDAKIKNMEKLIAALEAFPKNEE